MAPLPLGGALDDEEVLAGSDVADPPRRARELVEARGALEPCGCAIPVDAERRDLRPPLGELVARLEVGAERPDVEERDDAEDDDGQQEARQP